MPIRKYPARGFPAWIAFCCMLPIPAGSLASAPRSKAPERKSPLRYSLTILPASFICRPDSEVPLPFLGFHGEVVGSTRIPFKPNSQVVEETWSFVRPMVWSHGHVIVYKTPALKRETHEDEREAYANAIDASGRIFGKVGSTNSGAISIARYWAAIWPQSGAEPQKAPQVSDHSNAGFYAANRRGDALGYATTGTYTETMMFRYVPSGTDETIDTGSIVSLFHDGRTSKITTAGIEGAAINDHGEIVGNTLVNGPNHILFWDTAHKRHDLGVGYSKGLSNTGIIIGSQGFKYRANQSLYLAYFWTRAGKAQKLPLLRRCIQSEAVSINDSGEIVGTAWPSDAYDADDTARACLWRNGKVYDLNGVTIHRRGCILHQATSIDSAGHIVCIGTYQKQARAFLLTPLPPL